MAETGSYGAHELILTKAMLCDVSVGWGEVLAGSDGNVDSSGHGRGG